MTDKAMATFELVEKLKEGMRDTGKGGRPIYVMDEGSLDVFVITSARFYEVHDCFLIKVEKT